MIEYTRPVPEAAPQTLSFMEQLSELFSSQAQHKWQPGRYHYTRYRAFGGTGYWASDGNGGDVWVSRDIVFDRDYWSRLGYRHPIRWHEERGNAEKRG